MNRVSTDVQLRRKTLPENGYLESFGTCPICGPNAHFVARGDWLRDDFYCLRCLTIPRQRALMATIEMLRPAWRDLVIHESSPGPGGASEKLAAGCLTYIASHYDTSIRFGASHPTRGYQSEDLEHQTFSDESFDLVVTQDVFEHLFDPLAAAREIMRTLKPGGLHIASVPIVLKDQPSRRRADLIGGSVNHRVTPEYHGNPIDDSGSLVTVDWGYDICAHLTAASGAPHWLISIDDISRGIRADLNEILVGQKPGSLAQI